MSADQGVGKLRTMASVSTPPPQSSGIRTPPAPKHGYSDSWEPYPPRKSARLSSQKSANRTPSPRSSSRDLSDQPHHQLRSPRSSRKSYNNGLGSPAGSPQKKRHPAMDSTRRASGTLTAEGTAAAAAALGLTAHSNTETRNSLSARSGMLPTPAKTPARKSASAQNEMNIQAIARNLFAPDGEIMPSSKKRAKNYVLDSFSVDDANDSIEIYTDSNERIPELDTSAENPFWGNHPAAPEPAKRRSKRKQPTVMVPGEGERNVDEVVGREDGMVFVFRGKRKFYKHAKSDDGEDEDMEDSSGDGIARRLRRPLARSSVKPRLLFPTKTTEDRRAPHEDEEAVTDIEDHVLAQVVAEEEPQRPQTPVKMAVDDIETPDAPRFAPASPPATVRATRSGNKATTPMKPVRGGKRSPFDGWARTKNGSKDHGHKRPGEALEGDGGAKRTRT